MSVYFDVDEQVWGANFKNEDTLKFWYKDYEKNLSSLVRGLKKAFDQYGQ